jgi:hypothetical protein
MPETKVIPITSALKIHSERRRKAFEAQWGTGYVLQKPDLSKMFDTLDTTLEDFCLVYQLPIDGIKRIMAHPEEIPMELSVVFHLIQKDKRGFHELLQEKKNREKS